MLKLIATKLMMAALVALTVSAISFSLVYMAGDPAISLAGENSTAEDIRIIRERYGFDRPVVVQYLDWVWSALRGDLGTSHYFNQPVSEIIMDRLGTTVTLGVSAIILALVIALPLGVVAAVRPNSWIDRLAVFFAVVGEAIPSFWFGLLLIVIFAINLGVLPASGSSTWQSFVLPTIVLGYFAAPALMRLTRAGMIDVLSSDYIRTAKAKGLKPRKILFKHALRNAVIPVVSLAAVQMGFMLGGSVVVETVFALHGAGFLAWQSISRNDLPVMQALILMFSMFYIVFTFLADVLNAWLDPRLRGG
ncbi:ABC transporter permease [Ketogulonicigenium vulgare]|uniref:Peptide ABC transporter, permease protein n=1 Tax=Ketogulonicigenium vulgare (strain WSH-001) TaxID=759362 RepID=F9Y906_KETVW|nr:ABC transporter permease [Ketogulonicigenium vulgare]ADO41837.1 Binding-protein-dependent transport systems inner membrane component [Ketogulonicigenium vulgare Y25]AEM40062.1 Peptide ABC transporter, permease protein [Ketogulonicigenium vulgare WSH-001]ALJ80266.1 ABC transporter permease [Ketogulonicigenium vulgare]ANW33122.1 ABC transporter permease [Ketogulonicigenium vulgare]AOZ53760.1 Binding-protein-dependent transporters inner membrane component [Ketogulonicigenium vulgare]